MDSAIATALCQGIISPGASGLGGGHIMLIRFPNGTAQVVDAREPAPSGANETMFVGQLTLMTQLRRAFRLRHCTSQSACMQLLALIRKACVC